MDARKTPEPGTAYDPTEDDAPEPRGYEVIEVDGVPGSAYLARPGKLVVHRDAVEVLRPVLDQIVKGASVTSALDYEVFDLADPQTPGASSDSGPGHQEPTHGPGATSSSVSDALERIDEYVKVNVILWDPPPPPDPRLPDRVPEQKLPYGPLVVLLAEEHGEGGPADHPEPAPELPAAPLGLRGSLPGDGVTVAVLDSGANVTHPWFRGRVQSRGPQDDDYPARWQQGQLPNGVGHGTFVAGCVLRCAPGAIVVARKVLAEDGSTDDLAVATALLELAEMTPRVDIVNLSLGGYNLDDARLSFIPAALDNLFAANPDVIVVACAGNRSSKRPFHPAADGRVIGVGALEDSGERAGFSNYGDWVDAFAPGVRVVGPFVKWTDPKTDEILEGVPPFATWSGTSFAAPMVAGMIARTMRPGGESGTNVSGPKAASELAASSDNPRPDTGRRIRPNFKHQ